MIYPFAQALEQPDGKRVIRLTLSEGVTHDIPAPRQHVAPTRVSAKHLLGVGVYLAVNYDNGQVDAQQITFAELPPYEHP